MPLEVARALEKNCGEMGEEFEPMLEGESFSYTDAPEAAGNLKWELYGVVNDADDNEDEPVPT